MRVNITYCTPPITRLAIAIAIALCRSLAYAPGSVPVHSRFRSICPREPSLSMQNRVRAEAAARRRSFFLFFLFFLSHFASALHVAEMTEGTGSEPLRGKFPQVSGRITRAERSGTLSREKKKGEKKRKERKKEEEENRVARTGTTDRGKQRRGRERDKGIDLHTVAGDRKREEEVPRAVAR